MARALQAPRQRLEEEEGGREGSCCCRGRERESIEGGVGIGWAWLGLQGLPGTHGLVPGTLPRVGTYASLWTFLHRWRPAAVPTMFGAAVPPCLWAELNQTVPAYSCSKKGLQRVSEEDVPWGSASSEQDTSLCRREILQIPRTLTKLPCYAHARPAGDVCAKDAVYQSLGWLCRQPTSISVVASQTRHRNSLRGARPLGIFS